MSETPTPPSTPQSGPDVATGTVSKPTCGDCIFLASATRPAGSIIGNCHRYPPTQPNGGWPLVGERDWCGEFVPAVGDSEVSKQALVDWLRQVQIS